MPDATTPQVNREIERLATIYANLILRLAHARLGSVHTAQDICQDVFVKLIRLAQRDAQTFQSPEHEKAWVIRATINACINEQQLARNRNVVPLETDSGGVAMAEPLDTDPALLLEAADERRRVMAALDGLSANQRQAIYLHYYEGYSARDIARLTDESPATVRQHLSRGRAKLRTLLEGDPL